ncbi:queuosine precursor transporter [Jiulongibacter sediminis]|uniref:Probable queuosine precursor transporter n=1 Tax=Jiulongibacter sediminis TaxID=1605367 RepID=A0A0N8HA94_9BACT|nr:queuosine precursor transporter [Jiulongibacter sediminis]KPM49540.1 membrane protein [Jiulongibacter sediminis]TBX26582.1 membrane protein [Jiulongibacter sediminis]
METKKQKLYIILCGIFLTNAITAEIIGAKIFSLSDTLGMDIKGFSFLGMDMGFALSAGTLNWPIVFIISDVINEYFGKKGVKFISYLTAALITFSFAVIYLAVSVRPAEFWLDVNSTDTQGNPININEGFKMIFRQGMGIIIGSIAAFLIGQILDALVFHRLRRITENRLVWLRATGSTVFSQFFDSFLVIFIAFYVFGNWSFNQVIQVGTNNYLYKFLVAIALTPLVYLAHFLIDKWLGKENSKELISEATNAD